MSGEKRKVKMYLGNLQEKTHPSGDKFLTGSLCVDDIDKVPAEYIHTGKNGKRYLRIFVNPYWNGPNEYGNTHSIAVEAFNSNNNNDNNEENNN